MRQKEITANKADTSASSHRQLPFQTDVSDCKELLLKQSANPSLDLFGKTQSLFHSRRLLSSRPRRPRGAGTSREPAKGKSTVWTSGSWSFIRRKNSWGILQKASPSKARRGGGMGMKQCWKIWAPWGSLRICEGKNSFFKKDRMKTLEVEVDLILEGWRTRRCMLENSWFFPPEKKAWRSGWFFF